ncbi:hypothetical protein ColLi_12392 [Colletotrichum liriopes]|uniref:Uncharacterized protein n=1 Tax=Colletotrichum liriopes TaxID=708192 RepID=A0AA37GZ71_9PEZI|nr:hypothetical protein ColLi_12392 [Colletotrichum liriopes]
MLLHVNLTDGVASKQKHPDRFRLYAVTNPGLGAREAEHGHMELEFPGPMPDHLGVSVTVTDYTRVDQHGHKHGVINSAFNVLDQEHVFTAYYIIGLGQPGEMMIRSFNVEGVRLHLQRAGFIDTE